MNRIWADEHPTKTVMLPWQKAGLSYTATGYGARIPSSHMIEYEGRWRRVYVTIYSNAGTAWITVKGQKIVVEG